MHECESRVCVLREACGIFDALALSAAHGFPFANETGVQIANPVSFLAQKILIHRRRNRDERAKDILYMHDTVDTFATRIDDLSAEWSGTSGTSCTPTVFAPSKAQRQHSLAPSPIRFVPHLESSRPEIRLQRPFVKPAAWDSVGFSEQGDNRHEHVHEVSRIAKPSALAHSIHIEDFYGVQFERLVFPYHWRSDEWRSPEWYCQVGSDLGRDIWGVRDTGPRAASLSASSALIASS
jgi:hypothetical protein